jgi:hypothetical protein
LEFLRKVGSLLGVEMPEDPESTREAPVTKGEKP